MMLVTMLNRAIVFHGFGVTHWGDGGDDGDDGDSDGDNVELRDSFSWARRDTLGPSA